ncbi:MAG: hypothetical protein WCX74_03660 [Candidatus Paceibacterota bacterium]
MQEEWNFGRSEEIIALSGEVLEQCYSAIEKWVIHFVPEPTWIFNTHGVHSILIRLDCIVDQNEKLRIYEVEERPCGAGIVSTFNPVFEQKLRQVKKTWPSFEAVISHRRKYTDDLDWIPPYGGNGSLVLVRAEPEEGEFHCFQPHSVSTIVNEGNKQYGVGMGLWASVTPETFSENGVWKNPFCLKPSHGSKCQNLEIWHPEKKFKSGYGISSRKRILETIEREGEMYLQDFIEPMRVDGGYMIYRIYFGYNMEERRYEYIGGCYNIRPSFKIHGATDSIFGPVV